MVDFSVGYLVDKITNSHLNYKCTYKMCLRARMFYGYRLYGRNLVMLKWRMVVL